MEGCTEDGGFVGVDVEGDFLSEVGCGQLRDDMVQWGWDNETYSPMVAFRADWTMGVRIAPPCIMTDLMSS